MRPVSHQNVKGQEAIDNAGVAIIRTVDGFAIQHHGRTIRTTGRIIDAIAAARDLRVILSAAYPS